MIFTTAGEKGGSGRSTIAEHFTVWLSKQGFDVLFIDADEQGTASDFTAWREQTLEGNVGYTLVQLVGANLRKQVETMKPKYNHSCLFVLAESRRRNPDYLFKLP